MDDDEFLDRFFKDDNDDDVEISEQEDPRKKYDDSYDKERVYYENYDEEDNPVPSKKELKRTRRNNSPLNGVKWNMILIVVFVISSICMLLFLYLFSLKHEIFSRGAIGVKAVNYLYDFSSIDDLEGNLSKLADVVTEDVYKDVAVTNSDKALNTYLKFKKNPVTVSIIDSKPGFVLYTLDTNSLSSGRKFIFSYTVNWMGKIDSVREMEAIDFYETK